MFFFTLSPDEKTLTTCNNYPDFKISEIGKKICIPSSVTTIGVKSFYYNDQLTSIIIPNSVTTIGNNAFGNCSKLTSISIPKKVTMGTNVFSGSRPKITYY